MYRSSALRGYLSDETKREEGGSKGISAAEFLSRERNPRCDARHAARSPVNTRLICRGVHKKFMAGNQEPMPRHIKRSTGGRSRGSGSRSAGEGGGGRAPTARREIANPDRSVYLYRSAPYFSVSPSSPPSFAGRGTRQALKLNSRSGRKQPRERPSLASGRVSRICKAYKFHRGEFYAKV